MIIINERFLSAEHIQHIYVEKVHPDQDRYAVVIQFPGNSAVFGRLASDAMTKQMAFELRRRIINAIIDYKSSHTPEVQYVDLPPYKEGQSPNDSENS